MNILTTDIYEGAYLLSQGMQLERLWLNGKTSERSGDPDRPVPIVASGSIGRKRSVVFEFAGPEVELLRKDYQKGSAQANVTKLKQSLTELKDRMFDLLRTAETEPQPLHARAGQEETRRYEYKQPTIQIR